MERIIRQADCAEQLRALGNIAAHRRIFLVHRAFGCDECHDTARTHLVQCFCKEIIVNQKILTTVPLVNHLEISERHIAEDDIKMIVRQFGFLKSLNHNISLWIQLLRNRSGQRVQLDTV